MASSSSRAVTEYLAITLRRNWLAAHGAESATVDLDESLTQLDWLINFNMKTDKPIEKSRTRCSEAELDNVQPKLENMKSVIGDVDYKSCCRKPAHSYANLITMAIMDSEKKMLVLSDIYKWITDNYVYYRKTSSNWHNSVRHNLSMNRNFEKVARKDGDTSKGRYWKIRSDASGLFRENFRLCENRKRNSYFMNDDKNNNKNKGNNYDEKNMSFANMKRVKREKENMSASESEDILSTAVNMSDIYGFTKKEYKSEIAMESNIQIIEPAMGENICSPTTSLPKWMSTNSQRSNATSLLKKKYLNSDVRCSTQDIDHLKEKTMADTTISTLVKDSDVRNGSTDTDCLLSDNDPILKMYFDDSGHDLPLDLTTIDNDVIGHATWKEYQHQRENGSCPNNESRMSTPTGFSDIEQSSIWRDDLIVGDDGITDCFQKDVIDVFDEAPIFPAQYSHISYFGNYMSQI